jgi:hypothetical protein
MNESSLKPLLAGRKKKNLVFGGVQMGNEIMPVTKIAVFRNKAIRKIIHCANTEGIFRIIQSIPSPKAEPFKRWLARVGYERVQEIDDPELATKRTRALYKAKGYSDDWIEKRMRGIAIREELTDEWKKHGVERNKEYEIGILKIIKALFCAYLLDLQQSINPTIQLSMGR